VRHVVGRQMDGAPGHFSCTALIHWFESNYWLMGSQLRVTDYGLRNFTAFSLPVHRHCHLLDAQHRLLADAGRVETRRGAHASRCALNLE